MQSSPYELFEIKNQILFDFHKLALVEPSLRPYVLILNHRTVCNFKDQESLLTLTKAIMKHCFGLNWNCPLDNLCPRVPARLNYLIWVHLALSDHKISRVLDVGTGATLIYPLLGWKVFQWHFIATEIDQTSYGHSLELIKLNKLQKYIDLRLQRLSNQPSSTQPYREDPVITNLIGPEQSIDVVVCNPPFFDKACQTLTCMTQQQHHTQGGEYSVFFSLYRQSFQRESIQFFTCLIGLKCNFISIRQLLIQEHQQKYLQQVKFGQIQQGNNIRYIVLWKVNKVGLTLLK